MKKEDYVSASAYVLISFGVILITAFMCKNTTLLYVSLSLMYIVCLVAVNLWAQCERKLDGFEDKLKGAEAARELANKAYFNSEKAFREYKNQVELEEKINDTSHIQLTHTTEMMIDIYQMYQRTKNAFAEYVAARMHCSDKAAQKIVMEMMSKQSVPDITESDIYNKMSQED